MLHYSFCFVGFTIILLTGAWFLYSASGVSKDEGPFDPFAPFDMFDDTTEKDTKEKQVITDKISAARKKSAKPAAKKAKSKRKPK